MLSTVIIIIILCVLCTLFFVGWFPSGFKICRWFFNDCFNKMTRICWMYNMWFSYTFCSLSCFVINNLICFENKRIKSGGSKVEINKFLSFLLFCCLCHWGNMKRLTLLFQHCEKTFNCPSYSSFLNDYNNDLWISKQLVNAMI